MEVGNFTKAATFKFSSLKLLKHNNFFCDNAFLCFHKTNINR